MKCKTNGITTDKNSYYIMIKMFNLLGKCNISNLYAFNEVTSKFYQNVDKTAKRSWLIHNQSCSFQYIFLTNSEMS